MEKNLKNVSNAKAGKGGGIIELHKVYPVPINMSNLKPIWIVLLN